MIVISKEQINETYNLNYNVPLYFKTGKADIMYAIKNELRLSRWIRVGNFGTTKNGNQCCYIFTRNCKFHCTLSDLWSGTRALTLSRPIPKTQSDTIKSVKYFIRVYHNNNFSFAQKGERSSQYCDLFGRNAPIFLNHINKMLEDRNIFGEPEIDIDEPVKESFVDFCQEQKDLIELEQQFAKEKLFKGSYNCFAESGAHDNYGVSYVFYMDGKPSNSELEESTNVSIKSNQEAEEKIISGIITQYDDKNNAATIRFKKSEYYDIPKKGYIEESENVGYKYQKYAFDSIMKGKSNNRDILNVILENKCKKIREYKPLDFTGKHLNPSQEEAVNKAFFTEDFLLVQGPPGTGKTTIIIEMLKLFLSQGKRVLISSQNNLAVDNVLEKCMKEKVECIRLGREESIGVERVKGAWIENLIFSTQKNISKKSKEQENELRYNEKEKLETSAKGYWELQNFIVQRNNLCKDLEKRKFKKFSYKILRFLHIMSAESEKYKSFHKAYNDLENMIEEYNKIIPVKARAVNYVLQGNQDIANLERIYMGYRERIDSIPQKIQVVSEWREDLDTRKESLIEPLLKSVPVVGATCIGTSTRPEFRDTEYDVAIIDESGQITLHDIIVPITRAKKIVLVGDHLQLPPSDDMELVGYIAEKSAMDREEIREICSKSLFEQLFDATPETNKVMLDTQFRMHSLIAEFISKEFYGGKYKSGCADEYRKIDVAGYDKPIKFIDTRNVELSRRMERETIPESGKYYNDLEAGIIAKEVVRVIKELPMEVMDFNGESEITKKLSESDIGIIAAYKTQIEVIKEKLEEELCSVLNISKGSAKQIVSKIEIKSVDSFQGRDKEIIFYSFTRSNSQHKIGFLREVRRLNVMMTRAKRLLVMVGDGETLENTKAKITFKVDKNPRDYFSSLIKYCRQNKCYELWEEV